MNPFDGARHSIRLRTNSLRAKMSSQEFVIGTFLEIPSPTLVELLGLAGFDFVVIDREHGCIGLRDTEELIRASLSTGISPMVRVPTCEPAAIAAPLDMGAAGVHVPQISSAEMARAAVRSCKYHPLGERGLQPYVRAASYRAYETSEYLAEANKDTCVVAHIEGQAAVADLDAILQVEGLDVAFIGPYDLSQSLGVPGQVRHSRVREAIADCIRMARGVDKRVGTYCDDVETALEYRNWGVSYLTVSIDAHIFLSSARCMVSKLRS
ncbi:MAG TPA: aldolase/citrate lyase family protein [Bryobacteraceae bacterium]|nr:aldolase/citrate lyase family protein [Bryobacteraceae bacterium]